MTPLEVFLTGPGPDILLGLAILFAIIGLLFPPQPPDTKKPGA